MAQFSKIRNDFLRNGPSRNDDLFEVMMLAANRSGVIVDSDNPLPVTIGGESITITGPVSIPGEVEVSNDEGDPLHVDIVGQTFNLMLDSASHINVNVTSIPEVEVKNDVGNPLKVIGTDVNPWGKQVLLVDDDTVQHTSKNRRKVSTFELTDFATYTQSKDDDIWDEQISGTASAVHDEYQAMVLLEVGGTAGDEIKRQTKRVQRYIPGRQSEMSMVFRWYPLLPGIRRRVGLFDEGNGAYFEEEGSTFYCVIRRNTSGGIVETRVARDDWSDDKLDGTGPSGIVFNPSAIQQIIIEYEWYGAGQVEFKFVIDNNAHAIHKFNHANRIENTWSGNAALPVRVELANVTGVSSGPHYFWQGSHSFTSEGTTTLIGRQKSQSSPITGHTLSSANTFYPVVAIRLKSTALNSVVIPDFYAGATLDNTNIFIRVLEGAVITGGTWISYDSESAVEYNITGTALSNGTILDTVYVSSGNQGTAYKLPERAITQLTRNTTTTLGDTPATFVIAVAATGANKDGWASLGWIEVR